MSATHDSPSSPASSKVSRRTLLTATGGVAAGLAAPTVFNHSVAMATHLGVEVSHGHSVGFSWHILKDSPDGSKVLYVRFPEGNPGDAWADDVELWYASPTGTGRTKINVDESLARRAHPHIGAHQQWIDNQRIIYRHWSNTQSNWFPRVVRINGTVEQSFSAYPGVVPIHYHDGTKKVTAGRFRTVGGPLSDVWIIDPFTGDANQILDVSAFTPWQNIIGGDPSDWQIWHKYFNPAGTLIWAKLVNTSSGNEHAFTFNTSGGNIVHWDSTRDPKGHPFWWNNTTIWHPGGQSFIWNRDGSVAVGTSQAGQISHGDASPNRQLLAGERKVSGTFRLRLYERENTTHLHELFNTSHTSIIENDRHHVNPSFSRDGTKVYAVKPVSASETRLFMYDISQWA